MRRSALANMLAVLPVIAFAATWALLVLGHVPLDVHDLHWLQGDLAQTYMTWGQFLSDPQSHWLSSARMSYPLAQSVSLFDPMPLLLLLAKPFAAVLGTGRQYFGWYFLLCLVLQGVFGYLTVLQALRMAQPDAAPSARTRCFAVIGALFFVMMPCTAFRFQGHTSLSSQWLLALAMWTTLRTLDARRAAWLLGNCAVMLLATGIHPYLAMMVGINGAVFSIARARATGWLDAALRVAALLLVAAAGLWVFGFASGAEANAWGYGFYSMNALAPIDSNGWAGLLRFDVPNATGGQAEGFQYLGLGLIALMAFAVLSHAARARVPVEVRTACFPYAAALSVVVLCYALSFSTTLTFASHSYSLPIHGWVNHQLEHFRASGRFFWIGGFWLIVIGVVACATRLKPRHATWLLAALLLVQIADLLPFARYSRETIAHLSVATMGHVRPGNYAAILVYPPWQCDQKATPGGDRNYEKIGLYALHRHMQTNNFYAARALPEQIAYHCDYSRLERDLSMQDVYVLSADLFQRYGSRFANGFDCATGALGDASWVCVPKR